MVFPACADARNAEAPVTDLVSYPAVVRRSTMLLHKAAGWIPHAANTFFDHQGGKGTHTICFAAMHTVLMVNFRPHMSNKSSRFGPSRSITRTLCRPSRSSSFSLYSERARVFTIYRPMMRASEEDGCEPVTYLGTWTDSGVRP